MAGETPRVAIQRILGVRPRLTRRERRRLASAAPKMREALAEAAGGDWALVTTAARRQIMAQIAALEGLASVVREQRPNDDTPC